MRSLIRVRVMSILAVVFTAIGCADPPRRPNVILISLDTLRADHLGLYGYSRPTSPFLDELAAGAVVFDNEVVQVPGTLPSHMSIFTGLNPNEHGVFPPEGSLSDAIPTLPEILSGAGYQTAGFTEGGYAAGSYGFARGFDAFDDEVPKLVNDIEVVFSRGLEFLQQRSPSDPFFLFLHTYAIHDPYFPPLPYTTLYLEDMDPPSSFEDRFSFYREARIPLLTPEREEEHKKIYKATRALIEGSLPPTADLPGGPQLVAYNSRDSEGLSPEGLAYYVSLYDATINYVDDVMRAFFGSLEELDLLDNTIVIITSDHGEEFLEHGMMTHTQVYQECLRVPLIVVHPRHRQHRRITDVVRSIDIAPTILDWAGVASRSPMSGVSLDPLIQDNPSWQPLEAFARDVDNTGWSLHAEPDHLYQTVVHTETARGQEHWYSKTADFTTVIPEIHFRAFSYHTPRQVEVRVDGSHHSTLTMTQEWDDYTLTVGETPELRTITLRTEGCDVPAEVGSSTDQRCLSFKLSGFSPRKIELFDLTDEPAGMTDVYDRDPGIGASMAERMEAYDVPPVAQGSTVDLSPEEIERLKALGYMQ